MTCAVLYLNCTKDISTVNMRRGVRESLIRGGLSVQGNTIISPGKEGGRKGEM